MIGSIPNAGLTMKVKAPFAEPLMNCGLYSGQAGQISLCQGNSPGRASSWDEAVEHTKVLTVIHKHGSTDLGDRCYNYR